MDNLHALGAAVLQAQPFSQLLGAQLDKLEPHHATLSLTIQEAHKQQHGFVHGGVVSYLADNALTFAGGSVLGNAVTSEYKINYLRPAIGESLQAHASVLQAGKSQAVCECKIYCQHQGESKLVAVAQGTIAKVPDAPA